MSDPEPAEGEFSCSSPALTEAWHRGKEAVRRFSPPDQFHALPAAMQRIVALAAYQCFRGILSPALLDRTHANREDELVRVLAIDDHYTFTGDSLLLRCNYDRIRLAVGERGLPAGPGAFLAYAALRIAGRLALHVDSKYDSNAFHLRAIEMKRDLARPADSPDRLSQALGVAYGVFPAEMSLRLADELFSEPVRAVGDLFAALLAADIVRRRALERLEGAAREPRFLEGASPALFSWYLSTRVLGVTPMEPGYRTIGVAPALGHLAQASGSVPAPAGHVTASCESRDGAFRADIGIPEGSLASVSLPVCRKSYPRVTCNGAAVWEENIPLRGGCRGIIDGEIAAGRITFLVRPGSYAFEQIES